MVVWRIFIILKYKSNYVKDNSSNFLSILGFSNYMWQAVLKAIDKKYTSFRSWWVKHFLYNFWIYKLFDVRCNLQGKTTLEQAKTLYQQIFIYLILITFQVKLLKFSYSFSFSFNVWIHTPPYCKNHVKTY